MSGRYIGYISNVNCNRLLLHDETFKKCINANRDINILGFADIGRRDMVHFIFMLLLHEPSSVG